MQPMQFDTMQPTKLFFRCAVPSIVSMAVSSLYVIADGIFVGRYLGQQSLAAVNLVMPIIMICFGLADMVAVGSSVQISIQLGRDESDLADRTFSTCLRVLVLSSCFIGSACFFLAGPALTAMGAEPEVARLAEQFLRVFAVFMPVVAIFFSIDNYLRVCGKVRYSMVLNVVTSLLNILLDFLFIVVLGWGIWSSSLASSLSLTIGTLLSVAPFLAHKLPLSFVKGGIPLRQFGRLLANGASELFSNIASSVMMLLLNAVLLYLGGSMAVAACSVVLYADSIVSSMIYGLSDAMQPAISYCYGKELPKRVRALEERVLIAAAAISGFALLFMRLAGGDLIALFVQRDDRALLAMSLHAMELFSLSYLVNWVETCLSSYLTALDQPGRSLAVSLCRTLFFPAAALAILAPIWGLDGVWCMPLVVGAASAAVSILAVLTMDRAAKPEQT